MTHALVFCLGTLCHIQIPGYDVSRVRSSAVYREALSSVHDPLILSVVAGDMPELPGGYPSASTELFHTDTATEVERARKLIEHACKGYLIRRMQTVEDKLVYSAIAHTDYVHETLNLKYYD